MEPQLRQRDEPKRQSKAEEESILKRIKRCEVETGEIDVSDAFNESDADEVANGAILIFGKMGGLS